MLDSSNQIKIASFGFTHKGGAGLSSLKLHNAFLRLGHDSRFFVAEKKLDLEGVVRLKKRSMPARFSYQPLIPAAQNIVSTGFASTARQSLDNAYKWADVILLRWISDTVSDFLIGEWSIKKKPIIWCLSDMAPITGGCHYSEGCEKFTLDCKDCPIVDNFNTSVLPSQVLWRRRALWHDITVVSPSHWLFESTKRSQIFCDKDVRYIQTGIEVDNFGFHDKMDARKKLGLPLDKRIIFCASHSVKERRKGFDLLQKALSILAQDTQSDKFLVVTAGGHEAPEFKLKSQHLGYIYDRKALAMFYAACDVTALAYREDNLPNVLLESVACGTPVVAFDVGGMGDVIIHDFNGKLVKPWDLADFAQGILDLLLNPSNRPEDLARWAHEKLDVNIQARKYVKLFKEKLRLT